jgi:hypothetical protein
MCAAVMDGLMEVRRNMAAIDVVKMERDSLKLQLQASQSRVQQQQQQQQQQQLADFNAQPGNAGSSPSAFRALAISEISEKEQAVQQLQAALDDSNNKLMQQEVLVRVRTESERQVPFHFTLQPYPCVIFLHRPKLLCLKQRNIFRMRCKTSNVSPAKCKC